jgi:hypothetical protein
VHAFLANLLEYNDNHLNYILQRDTIITTATGDATTSAADARKKPAASKKPVSFSGRNARHQRDPAGVVIDRNRTYSDAEYISTILRAWTSSCDTASQARAIRREVEHFLDLDTRVSPSPNNILAVACLDCLAALETDPRKFFKEPSFAFDGFVHHKNPRVRWAALRCIIRVYVEFGAGASHETLLFLVGRARPSYEFDPDVRARTMECLARVQAPAFFHTILIDRDRTEKLAHVLWSLLNEESHFDHRLRRATYAFYRRIFAYSVPTSLFSGRGTKRPLMCRKGNGQPPLRLMLPAKQTDFFYTPPAYQKRATKHSLNTLCGIKQRPDDYGTSPGQMVVRVRRVGEDGAFMTLGNLAQVMREKRAEEVTAGGGGVAEKDEEMGAEGGGGGGRGDDDDDLDDLEMVDSEESDDDDEDDDDDDDDSEGDGGAAATGGSGVRMSLTLNFTGDGGVDGAADGSDISDISDLSLDDSDEDGSEAEV